MSAVMDAVEPGLSKQQYSTYIAVIESLLIVETAAQFLQWTKDELQNLFPHEIFVCGIGRINADSIKINRMLSSNFPVEYIQAIRRPGGDVFSPIMARWSQAQRPQLFEAESVQAGYPASWLATVQKYQLRNIAAHGLRDLNSNVSSYFNFSRIPGKLTPRHAYLLALLVPHLHVSLVKVLTQIHSIDRAEAKNTLRLSPREREILQWIQHGKTSWEIAQILDISEKTVRNHVQNALVKLRVKTRTQAVDKAKRLNILHAK